MGSQSSKRIDFFENRFPSGISGDSFAKPISKEKQKTWSKKIKKIRKKISQEQSSSIKWDTLLRKEKGNKIVLLYVTFQKRLLQTKSWKTQTIYKSQEPMSDISLKQ